VIEEEINIGILAGLAASGRTEQVKVLDAELLQPRFVVLEPSYRDRTIHLSIITQVPGRSLSIDAGKFLR